MLRRWRRDVIQDALINSEVHEVDAQLALNFGLFFDRIFDDHSHLLNRIHFGLLSDENPVLEHLVEVKGSLAGLLKLGKGPVADLDQAEAED